jgi:hypothetical protein
MGWGDWKGWYSSGAGSSSSGYTDNYDGKGKKGGKGWSADDDYERKKAWAKFYEQKEANMQMATELEVLRSKQKELEDSKKREDDQLQLQGMVSKAVEGIAS